MSRYHASWTRNRYDRGEYKVHMAPRCGYCRKKAYPSRRIARRALRIFYPASRGLDMNVYPCRSGGTGWHIGHRNPYVDQRDDNA